MSHVLLIADSNGNGNVYVWIDVQMCWMNTRIDVLMNGWTSCWVWRTSIDTNVYDLVWWTAVTNYNINVIQMSKCGILVYNICVLETTESWGDANPIGRQWVQLCLGRSLRTWIPFVIFSLIRQKNEQKQKIIYSDENIFAESCFCVVEQTERVVRSDKLDEQR